MRSFTGCWTCRVRRKKCDEKTPVCGNCALLHIKCNYEQDKPSWMDGGPKQAEMVEQVKKELKESAHLRREERHARGSSNGVPPEDTRTSSSELLQQSPEPQFGQSPEPQFEQGLESALPRPDEKSITQTTGLGYAPHPIGTSESVLLTFYLEELFPYLFPFYRPSILQGGRAWILELMIRAPVLREALLSTSSYFLFKASKSDDTEAAWKMLLERTAEAFGVLGQAMQLIDDSDTNQHLQGASRVFTSLMLVQRFEVAVASSITNQTHLNTALAFFAQLMQSSTQNERFCPRSSFESVLRRLDSSSPVLPAHGVKIPSAEHAAFRFSSALLIWDDIIDSTTRQQRPQLYDIQHSLLDNCNTNEVSIDMSDFLGCQNWVLLQISEIAVLDEWKEQCRKEGGLDVMHLVQRAGIIRTTLLAGLEELRTRATLEADKSGIVFETSLLDHSQSAKLACQVSLVTQVWADAALLYLSVVVSGWQPAITEVRSLVGNILQLLNQQPLQALLQTMMWPFTVAGSLAEKSQEHLFRLFANSRQPAYVLGIVQKALSIMENAWKRRDVGGAAEWNLAKCFQEPQTE